MLIRPPVLVLFLVGGVMVQDAEHHHRKPTAVFAVNCGGEEHTDTAGVNYQADANKAGTASDYGKQLMIGRVPEQDQILYQTERYHTATFGYDMNVDGDGEYTLILKMSELYFYAPNIRVFDVVLNGDLTILSDLDIYEKVGRGVAHDEYIEFEIEGDTIFYESEKSEISAGKIRVEFIKSYRNNPKVNAIVLVKGKLDDEAKLPSLAMEQEGEDDVEEEKECLSKRRTPSGPRIADPYENEDSLVLPVLVAIAAIIPVISVFCFCKLKTVEIY